MHPDLPTVLLFYNTSLVAGALSLLHVSRHACRPQGLRPLATAYLMLAIGSFLAWKGEHALLPPWAWTHGSLAQGTFGYTLLWIGVRRFSGDRRVGPIVLMPAAICLVLGIVTGFPLDNLSRAGVFHAAAVLALGWSACDVLRDRAGEPLPSRTMLAGFLCLSSGVYGLQLALILMGAASPATFSWAFYVQMFCHFGIALIATAMSNERAQTRLAHAASTDPLTGIGNRRWVTSRLPASLPLHSAVLQLDIDAFKRINDTYGHGTGDVVLVEFTRCVRQQLRESDVFGRMGGEEFLVYLPQITHDGAAAMAERLRQSIECLSIEVDGMTIPITVSIGFAWAAQPDVALQRWLKAADDALYQAKAAGRNLVRSSAPTDTAGQLTLMAS